MFSFLFSRYYALFSNCDTDTIRRMELHLLEVLILFKIKFEHTQVSVPKTGVLISKVACVSEISKLGNNIWINLLLTAFTKLNILHKK